MKSPEQLKSIPGRGALSNPTNRFEELIIEDDSERDYREDIKLQTQVFIDKTKSILSRNDSPDVGLNVGVNPYRGCEHGCVYCFARPTHEYLGFSSGLDFESRIMAKPDAPYLLRKELSKSRYKPDVIALSGNTDSYQPIERKLQITRKCLEVLAEFRNPVAIITKNRLVERDIDILSELSQYNACSVNISLTTLDKKVARTMEPRASSPVDRLKAIEHLAKAGIRVNVMTAPIIPGINDFEIPGLLRAASNAGAKSAHYIVVRLPHAVKDIFVNWLEQYFPERKNKVLNHIRSMRDGKLYDSTFGARKKGKGQIASHIRHLFFVSRKKYGLDQPLPPLSLEHFRNKKEEQMELGF